MQNHVNSYYAASANRKTDYPALRGDIEADVCIVGAGFSGLSAALHLAEQGFKVAILEAAKVGFGATGRNGGQIVNSYSRDVDVLEKRYDKKTADALSSMIFDGGQIIRDRIKKYNIDCDLRDGGIFASLNNKQFAELAEQKKNWQRLGNNQLELLDANQIRDVIGTDIYTGGLLDMSGGHIHPLNLALGQADAFVSLGGQIFEQSAVTRIEKGQNPTAYTANGSIKAKYLVLTGNAYMATDIKPNISNKAIPCGTQVMATEPLSEDLARELLPKNYCVEDCNYLLDYYRLSGDNRLLFGGGVVYGAREPDSIERLLRPKMEKVFPQLKGVKIDYTWTGNFLLTYSRMPQFGNDDNVFHMQGYSGHGVTCSHLAGKLLAEALKSRSEGFDAFASVRHYPFPGGRHLQIPLTAMGATYYNLRDKLAI